ncbi:transglutaminase-like putative cysteine protease [Larkinella arboricola]|uniref:Transglutaminase-like putative cysteine protease n=1 Tax=Larkinella arboricola TaxID=643671 RepID=A0A327WZL8_LARAB|nr:transglutaminase family protein [Larkinella arboricola]RAJ98020.1 transglutaminase-like putative cysteine protease [Larkinella arboricola]
MKLFAGCELIYDVPAPAPVVLMLRPRSGAGQWIISEEYEIEPHTPVVEYTDTYGNLCQRLVAPAGPFKIRISLTAETADAIDVAPGAPYVPVQDLPDDTLQFLLPSRYCQSDRLGPQALDITAGAIPGYDQVEAIRSWIQAHITYQYGTSDATTSAVDTAEKRMGVCRDFAHLGIALCRSMSIPARMVVGYLYQLDPMDLHAWFEAFIDGRWYTFDATQKEPRGNRIVVAYGRDAADVALATQYGPMTLQGMRVWVEEKK